MNKLLKTINFPEIEGLDVQAGLLMNGGVVSEYIKALNVFCFEVEEKAEELSFCIRKKDLNLYITIVRAFEIAAVRIGAVNIADFALELKNAYENEAIDFIMQNNKTFVSLLCILQKNICFALRNGLSEISKDQAGDDGLLNASLRKIKKALKNMAIGEAKAALTELKTKTWENGTHNMIVKISRHILLFEYEEAIRTIDLITQGKEAARWKELRTSC